MGAWHYVGAMNSGSTAEFQEAADRIIRAENTRGRLAAFFAEPLKDEWGHTRRDLPGRVMEELAALLESPSPFVLTPGGLTQSENIDVKNIEDALDSGKIKFLVGLLPDGVRKVAIVLLT